MSERDELRQGGKLLAANGLFLAATFALHILLARRVGVDGNADWTTLWAVILVVSSLFPSVVLLCARYIARFHAIGGAAAARGFARRIGVGALLASVALGWAVFYVRGTLREWLYLPDDRVVCLVAGFLAFSFLLATVRGVLEGLQRFSRLAFNIGLEGALRFGLGSLLMLAGYGIHGLLFAYALAALIPVITGVRYLALSEIDLLGRARSEPLERGWFRDAALFVWPVLIAHLLIVGWTNVDMLLIKRFADRHTAGLYGMLFVAGKVILFVAEALASVMVPKVAAAHRLGGDEGGPLRRTALLLLGFSVAVLLAGAAAPRMLIEFFYGEEFAPAARWLPVYLLAAVAMGLTVFAAKAHLARGRVAFVAPLTLGIAFIALTVRFYASDVGVVVATLAGVGLALAVVLWAPLWSLMGGKHR